MTEPRCGAWTLACVVVASAAITGAVVAAGIYKAAENLFGRKR